MHLHNSYQTRQRYILLCVNAMIHVSFTHGISYFEMMVAWQPKHRTKAHLSIGRICSCSSLHFSHRYWWLQLRAEYLMICQFLHCAMTPFFVLQHNYLIQQFFLLISVAAWLKLYEPEVVVFGWHGHNFANFWHILFDVLSQCHAPRCDVRVLVWNVFFSTNEPLLDRCGISVLFVQMPLKYCNGAPLFASA